MSKQEKEVKVLHRVIRILARWATVSFFHRIHIIGAENIPQDGPLIVTATHHNMMLDPVVLSSTFPGQRILNYWSKAALFGNPVLKYILTSTGNIPVARKTKDRRVLFKGTFDALSAGWAVALFPEGTSYTDSRIMQIKDGAAWAALEYTKWSQEHPDKANDTPVKILPAAMVYTNKSKYRSDVVIEFSKPITMDEYMVQFMDESEGSSRAAVKRLRNKIYSDLIEGTINSPDWDTLFAARMARDLLWEEEASVPLDDFVSISQTLVDVFATPDVTSNVIHVRRQLLVYYSLLQSTGLTNSVLCDLPLPATLDPSKRTPLTLRLRTLFALIPDTLACMIYLPFFFFPLIVHLPVYILARIGAKLVIDEEETLAQNKVVLGLLAMFLVYPTAFFVLWALFLFSPIGALLAWGTLYVFAMYHNRLVDHVYLRAKKLMAAWRVLLGVWTPKRFDLPLEKLANYTTPLTPPTNPWIERPEPTPSATASPVATPLTEAPPEVGTPASLARVRSHKAPIRRVIRHVIRARAEAVRALTEFMAQLGGPSADQRWVHAAPHLAALYGGRVENLAPAENEVEGGPPDADRRGWRTAREVLDFLASRGAKVETLKRPIEGEWIAQDGSEDSGREDGELRRRR